MRITVQLIENCSSTPIPSIIITANNQKYIFNVPETFQRFSKQHRFKSSKGNIFFFTKTCSATVTGILGFLLTLVDQGQCYQTKIYMPPRLFDYFNQIRYQNGSRILPYGMMDWTGRCQKGIAQQSIQKLMKNEAYSFLFHHINQYIAELPQKQINNPQIYFKKGIFQDSNLKIIPIHIKSNEEITHYICISNKVPGKVNSQKLKQFNIKGKNISKFMNDGQLLLEDGQKVFAKDFRQQDQPGSLFMILHFDKEQTLISTLENSLFNQYVSEAQTSVCVIQDPNILIGNNFRKFISLFDKKANHLLYCKGYRDIQEYIPQPTRHYKLTNKLSKVFPKYIPPIEDNINQKTKQSLKQSKIVQTMFPDNKIEMYKRYYELVVSPSKSKSYNYAKSTVNQQQLIKQIDFKQYEAVQKLWNFGQIDPHVVFLGTGSMKPSADRNVSGIFVGLNKSSMILDCGQGTYQQLINHFHDTIQKVILSLRVIFITHVHSDHHLGILNLISQRKRLTKKLNLPDNDLFLIIPYNLAPAIWAYDQYVQKLGCSVLFTQTLKGESYEVEGNYSKDERKCYKMDPNDISNQHYSTPKQQFILQNYFNNQNEVRSEFQNYLESEKIKEFNPIHVIHCPQSFGIVIKHQSGAKISYSGDTRPCPEFVKASIDSTLMIHEATFGDDLADNARQNYHSTVKQAIQSGMQSNSWRLALTHFSQRYKNSASILNLSGYQSDQKVLKYAKENSIVCFDHLQMKLSQCEFLPEISRIIADLVPSDK